MISDIKLGYSCNDDCVHCVIAANRDRFASVDGRRVAIVWKLKKL